MIHRRKSVLAALALAAVLGLYREAGAQILRTYLSPEAQGLNDFGTAVAVVQDLVAVSARGGATEGQRGVVDLFDVVSGAHVARVDRPPVGPVVRSFGRAMVGIDDMLVVADRGYVYVFAIDRADQPVAALVQTITPPVPDPEFGSALAAAGSRLVVGGGGQFAYVYEPSTGALLRSLQSGVAGDSFGFAVAGTEGFALVGAPGTTVQGKQAAGAAYLFRLDSGAIVHTLFEPDVTPSSFFGISVAFIAGRAAVGAAHELPSAAGGTVHLFDASTGAHQAALQSPVPVSGDRFGIRMQAQAAKLAVTAGRVSSDGTVFVFDVSRLDAAAQILQNPGSTFSGSSTNQAFFGYSTAFVGKDILVGAPKNNLVPAVGPVLIGEGAVFLFEGVPPPGEGLVAALEVPGEEAVMSGIVPVQGWAYTTTPGADIQRLVEVHLDGQLAFRVPCCSDRRDVQTVHPDAPALAGFSGAFNWQLPAPGEHEIEVRVFDTTGASVSMRRTIRTVRLTDVPFVRDATWNVPNAVVSVFNAPGAPADAGFVASGLRFTRSDGTVAECVAPNGIEFSWDRGGQTFRQVSGCVSP